MMNLHGYHILARVDRIIIIIIIVIVFVIVIVIVIVIVVVIYSFIYIGGGGGLWYNLFSKYCDAPVDDDHLLHNLGRNLYR